MELRDVLKKLRGELGLNQFELANALHVSYTSVSRWESGKTCPNRAILSALLAFADAQPLSDQCRQQLAQAAEEARRAKIAPVKDDLFTVEHASLCQLIDDASFPVFVADLETDCLLYLNRKARKLFGGSAVQLIGKKCYECIMQRSTPCSFCQREALSADRLVTFSAFRPGENNYFIVQARKIQWNGRQAQVRYVLDTDTSTHIHEKSLREAAYAQQLSLRRELAADAVATVHYNLTHDTVSDVVSRNDTYAKILATAPIDEILQRIRDNYVSGDALDALRDRAALIRQYYTGQRHITVRHFISGVGRYFEGVFDLMQNPVTFDIEAFAQLRDITEATMRQEIFKRLFDMDYETIMTIDAKTGETKPFSGNQLHTILAEQAAVGDSCAGLEAYLRKYCADDDVERVIREASLPVVKERLSAAPEYQITYALQQEDKPHYQRTVYSYLDDRHTTILCAVQDITDLYSIESAKRNQLGDALRILQEQSGLNLARYDLNTNTFYCSSEMTTSLGFSAVIENVPDVFFEGGYVAPECISEFRAFDRKLRQGLPAMMQVMLKVDDGRFHWVGVNGGVIRSASGAPEQAIIVFRDVERLREQTLVYRQWRESLELKKPERYTLFRTNLSRGTAYDTVEGSLLRLELLDFSIEALNGRSRNYASRFVHFDDFDAYIKVANSENLLAGFYRGTHKQELCYRERVAQDTYRWIHLTVEMSQYLDAPDIEAFFLYEHMEPPAEGSAPAKAAGFADAGAVIATYHCKEKTFRYDASFRRAVAGCYDSRSLWEIFMADDVADAADVKAMRQLVHTLAASPERTSGTMELLLRTPEGVRHTFTLNVYKRESGEAMRLAMAFSDIQDELAANERLRFQAERDGLTRLYNRAAFLERVGEAIGSKGADAYILLCCDVNDFRFFNNRYGREEGDRLLQFVGARQQSFAESRGGFAGRIGSDVFGLLLPNKPDALARIELIIRDYFKNYPLKAKITGRAGACIVHDPSMRADTLLDMAAMAKDQIKGKYDTWLSVFDESMNEAYLHEKYITDRMEGALDKGQFEVYIQPQFHHGTGQIVGAEALVRWNDPERGMVFPSEFIGVFEKSGFITKMDEYVWHKAAQYISLWIRAGHEPVPLAVNVSRADTNDPLLCEKLLSIIDKYCIPASYFRLEITESLFAENPKRLAEVVDKLHAAGFLVEMDDFGSGYSSLNILKDVPVDILKLDMRFLSGEDELGRGGMIINSVLRMSRWLNIPVIAEGVEVKAQADFLLSIGCPTIQGFLYEKPMPARKFEALLRSGGRKQPVALSHVDTDLDAPRFWDPTSMDSVLFNNYIGPAMVFEYHNGAYEIIRMNRRFSEEMKLGMNEVRQPTHKILRLSGEEQAKFKKAVLDVICFGTETKADVTREVDSANHPLTVKLRLVARSEERALIFAMLETS